MTRTSRKAHEPTEERREEERSSPERTCVGCRKKATPDELERFVYLEGQGLIFDLRQRAPGRGVYAHASPTCLGRAVHRGGFARGFKRQLSGLSADDLIAHMREGIQRRLRESLQSVVQARGAEVGATRVSEAVASDRVDLLLVAHDGGESTRQKYLSNAERKQLLVREQLSGELLGLVSGRAFVSVMGITDGEFARRIIRDMDKLEALGSFEG